MPQLGFKPASVELHRPVSWRTLYQLINHTAAPQYKLLRIDPHRLKFDISQEDNLLHLLNEEETIFEAS